MCAYFTWGRGYIMGMTSWHRKMLTSWCQIPEDVLRGVVTIKLGSCFNLTFRLYTTMSNTDEILGKKYFMNLDMINLVFKILLFTLFTGGNLSVKPTSMNSWLECLSTSKQCTKWSLKKKTNKKKTALHSRLPTSLSSNVLICVRLICVSSGNWAWHL